LVVKSAKISNGRIILQNDLKIYKKFNRGALLFKGMKDEGNSGVAARLKKRQITKRASIQLAPAFTHYAYERQRSYYSFFFLLHAYSLL
jgi:hypothetical protein